jgi:serine/threonine-protein kinase
MSPEQACGTDTVDHRSDVWSVAVVFFEALTGRCPFDGPSPVEIADCVLSQPVPSLWECAPWLPPAFAQVIQKGLERDLALRHQDLRAFSQALRACGLGEGACGGLLDVDGPAPRPTQPAPALPTTERAEAPTVPELARSPGAPSAVFPLVRPSSPPEDSRRSTFAALLAGVALLLVLLPAGITAGLYLGRRSATVPSSGSSVAASPTASSTG